MPDMWCKQEDVPKLRAHMNPGDADLFISIGSTEGKNGGSG